MSDKSETPRGTLLVYADDYHRLTADVERLRTALGDILSTSAPRDGVSWTNKDRLNHYRQLFVSIRDKARAALKEPRT